MDQPGSCIKNRKATHVYETVPGGDIQLAISLSFCATKSNRKIFHKL